MKVLLSMVLTKTRNGTAKRNTETGTEGDQEVAPRLLWYICAIEWACHMIASLPKSTVRGERAVGLTLMATDSGQYLRT